MHHRYLAVAGLLAAVLWLAPAPGAAQALAAKSKPASSKPSWTLPRTPDGQPDLQGIWANNNATPLERPAELAGRDKLTDEEVAQLRKKAKEVFGGDGDAAFGDTIFRSVYASVKAGEAGPHKKAPGELDYGTGDYSSEWTVERVWDNRTSLITDPADGRMPPMTAAGKMRRDAAAKALAGRAGGPEDRSLGERCITFGTPRLGAGYNSYYQILQTPKAVMLMMEMGHDARIISLDGRAHLAPAAQQWRGDSVGRWEGDTLVVDTTNYRPGSFQPASSDKLHVIERFTRTGAESLKYEVTIDDPETWTRPWGVMIPLQYSHDPIYEYACHEGNIGLKGILGGARADERAEAAKAAR